MEEVRLDIKTENKLLINYFIGAQLVYPLIFGVIVGVLSVYFEVGVSLIEFLTLVIVFLYTILKCKDLFKKDFERLNKKEFIKNLFKRYFVLFISVAILNLAIYSLLKIQVTNQKIIVENLLSPSVFTTAFLACIYAPIVEEVIFREIIFNKLNRKFSVNVSAMVSSLMFGFIHILPSLITGKYLESVYILVYTVMGYCLFNAYYKDKNLISSIALHMLNNIVSVVIILLNI